MDQTDCKEPFTETELERVLPPKLLELYHRIKQRKEIAAAGLEGLEECPFCDFKVVIENPDEKLLRCQREDCRAITCRSCKKSDHLPKSCKEMEEDTVLNGRHAVEEALSKALMRTCPKCKQNIIKDYGCNKMTCTQCGTVFCYICQVAVTGYDHFDQGPGVRQRDGSKCPLYDGSSRITEQMEAAAKEAAKKYTDENPDVGENELKVEVPKAANPLRPNAIAGPAIPQPRHYEHYLQVMDRMNRGMFGAGGHRDFQFIPPAPVHLMANVPPPLPAPPHRLAHLLNQPVPAVARRPPPAPRRQRRN